MSAGLAQSVQTRLVMHAKATGTDPNLVLVRYAMERLLYRLSCSPHADRFILKGGLMLLVWFGEEIRPTRDADLLGFGDLDADALKRTFTEICAMQVELDALVFDEASIQVSRIREDDAHGGQRVTVLARLGPARLKLQVDIGIGDVVSPEPEWIEYPSLLNLPRPRLRAYRPETSIAEKLHAMVSLGSHNSRMRDYFDLHALAMRNSFDGEVLARAIDATFSHRGVEIRPIPPIGLTAEFAEIEGKRAQWAGFLRRNRLDAAPADLAEVVAGIARFLGPVIEAVAHGATFEGRWRPGGPWETDS